jgi:hypothetical protein
LLPPLSFVIHKGLQVKVNILRGVPPRPVSHVPYDPEEDEPILEIAWYHLQIVCAI